MIWKIYAWVYAVAIFAGSLDLITAIRSWSFASWVDNINGMVLAIGVLTYSYRKELFYRELWKYIFVIILVSWVIFTVEYTLKPSVPGFLELSIPVTVSQGLLTTLFSAPALIAIYRMGFPRKTA